ncbi:MAG TPA: TlpA disulfide reductase family protein [Puia sp.]|nr:TlpA disulfide reductase family protein [Puia sp.]
MKKEITIILVIASLISNIKAQINSKNSFLPEVGKSCPNFILRNIEYYPRKTGMLKDFRGKWLILDFWNKGCISCMESFPKISAVQKIFEGRVQFMMVGFQDKENEIGSMYNKLRQAENLEMPCAFDSALYNRFGIWGTPYIVIIDPNGIVRGITDHLTSKNLTDFLAGIRPVIPPAYRRNEERGLFQYNASKPFLVNGNGGVDSNFLYRSLLSRWTFSTGINSLPSAIFPVNEYGRFEVIKADLRMLYMYAYVGKFSWSFLDSLNGKFWMIPILEADDTSLFQSDWGTGQNLYCYSLSVAVSRIGRKYLMEVMQRELKNYFGFDIDIEVRRMPYWRLVATEEARIKLKSKGEPPYYNGNSTQWKATNCPISILLTRIANYYQGEPPFIDETDINSNIDITMNCIWTRLSDVKMALKLNGLDLVKGEREMKVLVIKAPKINYQNE